MERAQAGDREAFGILYDRYHVALYAFLRRLGMSVGVAEEIVQESFLKVWRVRDRYRPGSFQAYLYTVARNLRTSALRRRAPDAGRLLEGRPGSAPAASEAPEQAELAGRLREAMADLPEDLRLPFVLKRMQGLSYAEVARISGLSLRQAEEKVAEAFASLAKRVAPEGPR